MSAFNEILFKSADGLQLYARDYPARIGAAKCPVICIHGLTRNSADFEELAPWIASLGRRVLAVDVRGRGRSAYDADPNQYKTAVYAGDIQQLARQLGIERAVFIGTSMGGLITMAVAMINLKLIVAAVLNDVGPVLSKTGLSRIAGYTGKTTTFLEWDDAVAHVANINQTAFPSYTKEDWEKWAHRAFNQNLTGEWVLKYDPQIALSVRGNRQKSSSWMAKFAFRRLARRKPTMLIRGKISDLIEPEQADYMRKIAPAMRYVEVQNVGHAPMLMEQEAMRALRQFLEDVD